MFVVCQAVEHNNVIVSAHTVMFGCSPKMRFNFFEQQLNYISRDPAKMSASLVQLPEREEIPILVEDHLVVEYMAR